MEITKKVMLVIIIIFYIAAGINHFRSPNGYLNIMPPYLPYPRVLNILAGMFEIVFGVMMIFPTTRPLAAWGIILMLIAFMPVHVYMIQNAPMKMGGLIITRTIAWARIPLQVLFILWAWWFTLRQ